MPKAFVFHSGSHDRRMNFRVLAGDMGERFSEHRSEKMRVTEKQLG